MNQGQVIQITEEEQQCTIFNCSIELTTATSFYLLILPIFYS